MKSFAPFLVAIAFAADPQSYTFEKGEIGKIMPGWTAAQTNEGRASKWMVVKDDKAPSKKGKVIAQTAEGPNAVYNLCVLDKSKFTDLELSVHVCAIAGDLDQGGGLVWRYQDNKNYYVCRMNPLEENFRLYKVIDGKRVQLATKESITVKEETWFTVSITHKGDKITCSMNGTKHLEATDDSIKKPGQIGLWTKADARSHFDLMTVREN